MPLDIAMQNAQLKTLTNVDYTNYLLCFRAVTIALLTIFSETNSQCLISCHLFYNGTLFIVELSISSHCSHHCLLWSDYDFIFIHHHVDELNKGSSQTELQD
jgi:hypothetical protein